MQRLLKGSVLESAASTIGTETIALFLPSKKT